jgi:thiamine-phosphate pyrophosphorylase
VNSRIPRLQAIVDVDVAARAGWDPVSLAQACLDGGARLLQVRAKQLPSGALLALCDAVVRMASPYGAAVIVNDRVDVARASGAAGAHVGQDDLGPAEARVLLGPTAIVGYSTHSVAQVQEALPYPVTYVAVGPVFGTQTKDTGYEAVGLDLISAARGLTDRPIVAIGGITLDNAASALAAGASCVAVISDLLAGNDPRARVRRFVDTL